MSKEIQTGNPRDIWHTSNNRLPVCNTVFFISCWPLKVSERTDERTDERRVLDGVGCYKVILHQLSNLFQTFQHLYARISGITTRVLSLYGQTDRL